jgi:hypothetical protein
MKVKFNKQVTVDYYGKNDDEPISKTFYRNEIVEVTDIADNGKFVDLDIGEGTALDIPKESLTIL